MKEKFQVTTAFVQQHERLIGNAALIVGAIFDWLTITKPDSLFGNISITAYLVVAAGSILLLNIRTARAKDAAWLTIIIQFCFGNLASGLLVLYSQSATLVGSWLFLLVLAGILIGNEFARARYARLRSHLIGFYILLCAYLDFIVPVLLRSLGNKIFALSSALSLALMIGYLLILFGVAAARVRADWKGTALGIMLVTGLFNTLYFFNVIPPVPLSLSSIALYTSVSWDGSQYRVEGESKPRWYELGAQLRPSVHLLDGEGAYCFSEVYAPSGLTAPVYYRWEYDDAVLGWSTRLRLASVVRGGREEGYRSYSFKGNLIEGTWRCSVETKEGSLIGRETFKVVRVPRAAASVISYK